MGKKAALLGVAAAATLLGGGGFAYAAASTVTVTTTDTVISTTTSHSLPTAGGVSTTVLTATVPAGSSVLSASGDIVNWGPSDYTRCKITVAGRQIAGVTTMVGNPALPGNMGPSPTVAAFSLTGGVTVVAPSAVVVSCWHDTTMSASGYVDPGATLTVHRTGSLTVATE